MQLPSSPAQNLNFPRACDSHHIRDTRTEKQRNRRKTDREKKRENERERESERERENEWADGQTWV
jgi:hypothetical protein